ncbi:hypothetical protein Taro_035277 [Colocasia esculenta]|uniref:Uncharacterized protein n=1 Tax=Colocasia esculenta TaxID=4460 RepID=A0A843WCQ3_COLES|nr:hypothetical protein [Colocasia esculenta]
MRRRAPPLLLPFLLFLLLSSLLLLLPLSPPPAGPRESGGDARRWLAAPFRAADILPLLPRRASWPILTSLRSAVDLLPSFVGYANDSAPDAHLEWKGACFYHTSAWLEFHNRSGSPFGGGTLHIKTRKPHSWTCMDLYIFATPYRVTWDYYFLARDHTFDFETWEGEAEYEYVSVLHNHEALKVNACYLELFLLVYQLVKHNGISIFLMESGMLGTIRALWDVFPLFSNSLWGENSNLAFLKKHMHASFEQRPQPWFTNVTVEDLHSGDLLVLSKIRGRWGGFETLEKWVTGSYAGHSAVCLRDSDGKLWVGESGNENEKGEDIIAILPWDEWWNFELNKDDSNPHIALLPLHPDMRAKFNETAAWEYAKSMSGKPYGYHNMIFSWIDTTNGNYPPPLNAHLVMTCNLLSKLIYHGTVDPACSRAIASPGMVSMPGSMRPVAVRFDSDGSCDPDPDPNRPDPQQSSPMGTGQTEI